MKNKLLKMFKTLWYFMFEVFVWHVILACSSLAITIAYLEPKYGICLTCCAVILALIPIIKNKFLKHKEEC